MTTTATAPVEQVYPKDFLRHLRRQNVFTAFAGGIAGFVVLWILASLYFQGVVWHHATNRIVTVAFIGWGVGFMAGIGAFNGVFRWFAGKDLDHEEAEYMAGKDLGVKRYFRYTTDHKVVGIQYLVVTMVILAIGGTLAMLIRTQLGISMELFNPNTYNSFVGTHGVAMVVGMILVVTGPIGNFIVPMMVGARDMAFPRLNALSLWLVVAALIPLVMSSSWAVSATAGPSTSRSPSRPHPEPWATSSSS